MQNLIFSIVILRSCIVFLIFGSFHKNPGGPNSTMSVLSLCATLTQLIILVQCAADLIVGVQTYQSFGVDIHSKAYVPLSSFPLYSVPEPESNLLCVSLVHLYPMCTSCSSAWRISSTISASGSTCILKPSSYPVCVARKVRVAPFNGLSFVLQCW